MRQCHTEVESWQVNDDIPRLVAQMFAAQVGQLSCKQASKDLILTRGRKSRKLPLWERVGASFNTSRSELGGCGVGGGGGGGILVGFFGYPRSGAGKTIVVKGACFGLDLGFFGKCFSETFEGEAGP